MQRVLEIKNLHVQIENKEILKGVNLTIKTGEIHAIMGPNGTGKSTLASVIMGNPKYEITKGDILLDNKSILDLEVDERARLGIFLAMQQPMEIPGVTNSDFLRAALNSIPEKNMSLFEFIKKYDKAINELEMNDDLAHRYLNEGFSGGEKKRNEILQLKMLNPNFAILDEIDSGLDVDALKIVSKNINSLRGEDFSCLMITHYQRLLDYIKPDFVHVMLDGRVVRSGKEELIKKIDTDGYDWLKEELNIKEERKNTPRRSLGSCAHNNAK